jgi:hypothetical protein
MVGLTLSMSSFIPVINSGTPDNKFGPGIYATNEFETAFNYARPSGAVMVFKDPDLRDLNVWSLFCESLKTARDNANRTASNNATPYISTPKVLGVIPHYTKTIETSSRTDRQSPLVAF